jgi:hypothetical protein
MMETIAHYKKWKVWARLALLVLLVLSIPITSVWIFGSADDGGHYSAKFMIISAWFMAIFLIREIVSIFKQVVFHGARLIWIENRQVIWTRPGFFSLPCKDITKVTGSFDAERPWFDTITLQLRDGSEKVIKTDSLDESCEEVVSRLRNALKLG